MAPTRTGPRPRPIRVVPAVTTNHHPGPARNPFALSNERAPDDCVPRNTAFPSHYVIAAPPRGFLELAITPARDPEAANPRSRDRSDRGSATLSYLALCSALR